MIFAERQLLDKPIEKIGKNNPKAVEIEAMKDSQYYEDVKSVGKSRAR